MSRKLRIGVDARALAPPMTGTGVYLRELLRELVEQSPSSRLFCYTTRPPTPGSLPERGCELRLGRGVWARWGTVWLQRAVPRLALRDGIDLFWGPLQVLPLPLIGQLPTVVSLHDLVFWRFPETMSWRNRLALAPVALRSLRRCDRVLALSETTAHLARSELSLEAGKIEVLRPGVRSTIAPVPPDEARHRVAVELGVESDYLLFVGTLEPRKNLAGLLDALALLAEGTAFSGEVVIAGVEGWGRGRLRERVAAHPLARRLRLVGYVDEATLSSLYSGARLFVMPSLYEGFGLPVLEAMSCGAPVVCSRADPFPEVAGEAALLEHADRPADFARAILRAWRDESLRSDLSERGRRHAAQFRWADSAAKLLGIIEGLVARGRPTSRPAQPR